MRHHLLPAIAVLAVLGQSSSFAQTAANTAATEQTAAAAVQSDSDDLSSGVAPELIRALREMALEADKKAAKPTPPKSAEGIAAERRAVEAHRAGLFARIEERQQ